ncbi:MAG: hypothetical protein R3B99_23225 [Polyangiales bacterium]|nr:hypothetical protein [Myxococcales bacterium]
MTHRFGTALVALALFASCSSSFEALGGDAGDVAMDDACVGCVEDADVLGDGGVSPDAGTCDFGWFAPDAPQYFDATATARVRAVGSSDRFYLGYLQGNPSPCDGPCGAALEVSTDGSNTGVMPAYWSSLVGDPPPAIDARRGDHLVLVDPSSATWQFRPLNREGWQNDGTFGATAGLVDGQRVADVGIVGMTLVLLTVPPATDELGYHPSLGIRVADASGEVQELDSAFPDVGGVKDPQYVDGTTWIAALQNWDFPPTVQLVSLAEASDIRGSSCGVQQFHAVGLDGDSVAVIQDCFPEGGARGIELHGRAGASGSAVITDRSSGVAPRGARTLTSTNGSPFGIAVVYVEEGASAPSLMIVDSIEPGLWLTNPPVTLPTASDLTLPITSVDVAAADDGTLLVTWSGTPADPVDIWQWEGPEAAYATVRRCR